MSVSDALRQRDLEERIVRLEGLLAGVPGLTEQVHKMTLEMRLLRGSIAALRAKAGLPARLGDNSGLDSDAA